MAKKRMSNFRGKVADDLKKSKGGSASYGYLRLPKGLSVFSPEPDSRVKLDFLPYEVTDPKHPDRNPDLGKAMVGELWWKRPFSTHRNIGAGNDSVVCLASIGKKCPICEYRAKKIKAGADKEDTDVLRPSMRNLYVVVPKGVKGKEEVPHVFDISKWLFQDLLTDEIEENDENEVFMDLQEGKTLKIRFASKKIGKGQPFAEADRIDFLERDEVYDESILEDVPKLDDMLIIMSYDELWAKFSETENEEDAGDLSEDDEDEKPKHHSHSKKKTVTKEDDDDDEDEKPKKKRKPAEDDDDDEDEDADDKHTRKMATRKPSSLAKHDKEDEDEDDDEEEEKPKRIVKKPAKKVEDDDEDEEEEDEPKPKRTLKKPESKKSKNRCPNGHIFGRDFDTYDDCADCPLFDECGDENDK